MHSSRGFSGSELGRFTRDLTAEARAGRLEPVRCRDREVARLIDILLRHGKNNPTLVGPAGVGKTAIAEGFAQRIAAGDVPLALRDVRLLSLDHVALLAGTTYRGQYEERIRAIVDETTAAGDVILFIDELHNLIGQGTALGVAMDAANMLKPALVRGDFRVIGATTDEEYQRWIQGDPALERRFQKVTVTELGESDAMDVLRARKERLERHHNVLISDDALVAAVKLTDLFVRDRMRPDKALDALDEACAHMQAVTKYSPRAAEIITQLRDMSRGSEVDAEAPHPPRPPRESRPPNGMTVLEQFGADLEAFFNGAETRAVDTRNVVRPEPRPAHGPSRIALQLELNDLLASEGVVVRPHDIARVVTLMCGQEVQWQD